MRGLFLLGSALAIFVIAGCARKESTSSATGQNAAPDSVPVASTQSPEHGTQSEQVSTSGSVADLFGRIHEQERQLDQIIASAQLSDVHKKAFAIRDLVVAAAATATEPKKAETRPHVDAVRTIASALDEAGDSGDLGRTRSEYQKLKVHLRAIEGALGVAGR